MTMAKGAKARYVLQFEKSIGVPPDTPAGIVLPFNSETIASNRPLNKSGTMTGRRDPSEPFEGNLKAAGNIVVPLDAVIFGYLLKAMFGLPTSTRHAAKALSGAAVNKSNGLVGLPCTGHGMAVGSVVTVASSTSYNGDYTVQASTSANEIVILKTFTAEIFSGATAQAKIYDHVFKVGDTMPSVMLEKGFTDIGQYVMFALARASKLALSAGGDQELLATVDFECAQASKSTTPFQANPTLPVMAKFNNFQATVLEAGVALATCSDFSLSLDFGLDTGVYTLGSNGQRGDLPEGDISASGTIKTLFKDSSLYDKALNSQATSLKLVFSRTIESLTFEFQEVRLERKDPVVSGPKGIYYDPSWQAYYASGAGNSAVIVTLTNQVASYA